MASDCVEIEVILPGTRTTPSLVVRCLSVTSPRPFANDNHHNYTLKPEHNYTLSTTTLWEGVYEFFLGRRTMLAKAPGGIGEPTLEYPEVAMLVRSIAPVDPHNVGV